MQLAGGRVKGGNGSIPTSAVQIYDPATATWTPTGSMRIARDSVTLQLLPDGRVLAATGTHGLYSEPSATAEIYDPSTGIWNRTSKLGIATQNQIDASLPTGVCWSQAERTIILSMLCVGRRLSRDLPPLAAPDMDRGE